MKRITVEDGKYEWFAESGKVYRRSIICELYNINEVPITILHKIVQKIGVDEQEIICVIDDSESCVSQGGKPRYAGEKE